MHWLTDPQIWASLLTLTALEIVLGIDNLVFVTILAGRLPGRQAEQARPLGLSLAVITRLLLLGSIAWLTGLTQPVFELLGHPVSWRDIGLIGGGLFLLYKGTREIHNRLEGEWSHADAEHAGFAAVVAQIVVFDMVFSLDSVITAVGMAEHLSVMALAIIIAVVIMLRAAGPLSAFIDHYPTVKMLALSFLLLVGMTLVADGAGFHIPKAYIYFAISFSIGVEALNQLAARRRKIGADRHVTGSAQTMTQAKGSQTDAYHASLHLSSQGSHRRLQPSACG
jgi:predicted tellurium resistance membrane protein TerC